MCKSVIARLASLLSKYPVRNFGPPVLSDFSSFPAHECLAHTREYTLQQRNHPNPNGVPRTMPKHKYGNQMKFDCRALHSAAVYTHTHTHTHTHTKALQTFSGGFIS